MIKRLQVVFAEDAWSTIKQITHQANEGFNVGSIGYSDVINELILNSKVDIKHLQAKHTDLRRSLRVLASQDEIDIDLAIKMLTDLRGKPSKKKQTTKEINHV
ncbi:MAG: hypothetical protein KA715_10890 [Xanthomonadaceae bacterium]|nr:hypothetical protein [Xanthomonadaceae bacterium]